MLDQNKEQCYGMKLFNRFLLNQDSHIYAWIYFDTPVQDDLYAGCSADNATAGWNITSDVFDAGFDFNFSDLSNFP